jgi:hypothetical protein
MQDTKAKNGARGTRLCEAIYDNLAMCELSAQAIVYLKTDRKRGIDGLVFFSTEDEYGSSWKFTGWICFVHSFSKFKTTTTTVMISLHG